MNYKIEHLDLYLNKLDKTQELGYRSILEPYVNKDNLNYTDMLRPLQCLNIYYPIEVSEEKG